MQHGGEQQVGAPVFGGLGEHLRCRQRGRFVSSEFAAGVGIGPERVVTLTAPSAPIPTSSKAMMTSRCQAERGSCR
jgi:hypothetical protein